MPVTPYNRGRVTMIHGSDLTDLKHMAVCHIYKQDFNFQFL